MYFHGENDVQLSLDSRTTSRVLPDVLATPCDDRQNSNKMSDISLLKRQL